MTETTVTYKNIAICGSSGSGVSSLINLLVESNVAKVGIGEKITVEPKSYIYQKYVNLWDISLLDISKNYDAYFVLDYTRQSEKVDNIIKLIREFRLNIPIFYIRSKIDNDVESIMLQNKLSKKEAIAYIKNIILNDYNYVSDEKILFISTRKNWINDLDIDKLKNIINNIVQNN